MGNNTVCKMVGIGNIRVRMFEGQVRTLMNVHYVPDLRQSLVRALEAQGCKFSGAYGGIKVTKGSMMILKREWTSNLYKIVRKHYYW